MVGWLNAREFEQAPGVGDGPGGLVCYSPWGGKELDTADNCTEWNLAHVGLCVLLTC